MTNSLRWRIMALQAVLVLVLAGVAGFCFWANSFTVGFVRDQLTAQQIYFPPSSEIKAGGALDPAEFPASIRQYAGQQVDNGDKAKEYANNFIGRHLQKVAGGKTYSQVSTLAIANPTDTKLAAQKATLFQGETLRGMLLNAWGWSQVGLYAGLAAWGLTLAAIAVAAAFLFELLAALTAARRAPARGAVTRPTPA